MSSYDTLVKRLGVEGAKAHLQAIGSKGGKKGGGKGGFRTMDAERLKEVSAKGGRGRGRFTQM